MNKGILGITPRKASALLVIAILLLSAISLGNVHEALADSDLTTAESTDGGKTPVPYVDAKGGAHECTSYTNTSALGSGEWSLSDGWYVLDQNVTGNPAIRVSGKVNLILCDGKTLVTTHVLVESGDALTIWAQQNGTGKLRATGAENYACHRLGGQ